LLFISEIDTFLNKTHYVKANGIITLNGNRVTNKIRSRPKF